MVVLLIGREEGFQLIGEIGDGERVKSRWWLIGRRWKRWDEAEDGSKSL